MVDNSEFCWTDHFSACNCQYQGYNLFARNPIKILITLDGI